MAAKARDLHVITVHSNPVRYAARGRLHREHQARVEASGATLWVVEAVFGNREPEVADPKNPRHFVVRCDDEIWIKEVMLNIGESQIPGDAEYVMWQDADIQFHREDWAVETIQALQHYQVVQPFSHVVDLGPDHEVIENHLGFAYQYDRGVRPGNKYDGFMHPGYCWAYRRGTWKALGGMMDKAICGAGDHHMALGLIGLARQSVHAGVTAGYMSMVTDWEENAQRAARRDIGHVPGTILHHFHGWKADRRYQSRWDILVRNAYDPAVDVIRDSRGMIHLAGNKTGLRDDLRRYFRSRFEDAGRKSWPA